MTTNNSGKLNRGGVSAIKEIASLPPDERTPRQTAYLNACLTALAHQPTRWYAYQDWGAGGPVAFLADKRIYLKPIPNPRPISRSWYDGCGCPEPHWREEGRSDEQTVT